MFGTLAANWNIWAHLVCLRYVGTSVLWKLFQWHIWLLCWENMGVSSVKTVDCNNSCSLQGTGISQSSRGSSERKHSKRKKWGFQKTEAGAARLPLTEPEKACSILCTIFYGCNGDKAITAARERWLSLPLDVCKHTQSCPTLCDPMGSSLTGSSVWGILQAGILERVAISFSRGSSQPKDRTHVSCISCVGRQILYQRSHRGSLTMWWGRESHTAEDPMWLLITGKLSLDKQILPQGSCGI